MRRSDSSTSSHPGDYEPRTQPAEVRLGISDQEFYDKYRLETDLREPYRIPKEFLVGTNEVDAPDFPEAPTIVFINSRSGGHAGPALATGLRQALGHSQVFDLSSTMPDKVLKQIWSNLEEQSGNRNGVAPMIKKRLRILAAGGDGTVAWVLQTIKRLDIQPMPAVGILPLGTGNDLSRSFGWGPTFAKAWVKNYSSIFKTLKRVSDSEEADLDCWKVNLVAPGKGYFKRSLPHAFSTAEAPSGKEANTAFSWNYVSVGLDAESAYGFHHLRETKPALASSRAANQFWYGVFGCKSGWFCCSKPVSNRVKVFVGEGETGWKEVPVPASVKAVVVCNLQSYAGGSNIWGKHSAADAKKGWKKPTVSDGLVEVVGLSSGYHTGLVLSGVTHGVRIAQCSRVRLAFAATGGNGKERSKVYMQLDGEPWKQEVPAGKNVEPFYVDMTSAGKSRVLINKTALPNALSELMAPVLAPVMLPGTSGSKGPAAAISHAPDPAKANEYLPEAAKHSEHRASTSTTAESRPPPTTAASVEPANVELAAVHPSTPPAVSTGSVEPSITVERPSAPIVAWEASSAKEPAADANKAVMLE